MWKEARLWTQLPAWIPGPRFPAVCAWGSLLPFLIIC